MKDYASCPSVSVVVPAFNAAGTIGECLDSLLDSEYPAGTFEIVVVDNASTDETPNILEGYLDRVRVVFEPTRGPGAARNTGIKHAIYDVIAMTDADCRVDKQWLRNIILPLRNLEVGVAGGRILSQRPCNRIEEFGEQIHDHDKAINTFTPPYIITMNCATRRDVLDRTGLFDTQFIRYEDIELSKRLLEAGFVFAYHADAVIYHKNEDTFRGLFHEGYLHGLWAVKFAATHPVFSQAYGHRRLSMRGYADLLRCLLKVVTGPRRHERLCEAVFNSGKKVGHVVGSVRFQYLDL